MSTRHSRPIKRSRPINRRTAEELLRGGRPDGRAGDDTLASLLAAAVAPASVEELAGEPAALIAFEGARLGPVPQPRRASMIKSTLAKLLTVKAAAILAAATAGGVALAASAGTLPSPLHHPAASHSNPAASHSATHPSDEPSPRASHGSPTPSPSLVGLCHAYTAGAGQDHGKALDNPAFTTLITAAGGRGEVDGFCAALLATSPGHSPTTHPTGPPSTHPTGMPANHLST